MIGAKSVSLCMVICNQSDLAERAINSVTFADEVVIVDQGSDFEHSEKLRSLATTYLRTTNKGNADYDRQYGYSFAKKEYIFALDADEFITEEDVVKFKELVSKYDIETAWFLFNNEISSNGITINIKKLIGDDPHPRFWKKVVFINGQPGPTLIWPHEAHQFPQINTLKQGFLDVYIQHSRKLEDVIRTHIRRGKNIDPRAQETERKFVQAVLDEFGEEVRQNVKLKFPELTPYLKGTTNG